MNLTEEKVPYTWGKLKEFCNSLSDDQLSQSVKVIQEDSVMRILDASEIGEDHYLFNDEEFSVSKSDFDPEYHLDGNYKSLEEALEKEEHVKTPATNVYLFEDF